MTNDPRLERYLTTLEKSLQTFPVSDRAEIITEIKSHIFSALDRDPNTNLDTVLTSLGEPETVANRYLLERGLRPTKTPLHPIFKWIVIGFLGTFAIMTIGFVMLVKNAGSIVKIDGDKGRVQVLGGLIDVDGEKERVSVNGLGGMSSAFAGAETLKGKSLTVKFAAGKFEFKTANDKKFAWGCKADGLPTQALQETNEGAIFDLSGSNAAKCEFALPEGVTLHLEGHEGKVDFQKPRFNIESGLTTGKVSFEADPAAKYKFDMKVDEGALSHFESSKDAQAYAIKVHVKIGKIGTDD